MLRDAIFDYYSLIFEVSIGNYVKNEVSMIDRINVEHNNIKLLEKLTSSTAQRQSHHDDKRGP